MPAKIYPDKKLLTIPARDLVNAGLRQSSFERSAVMPNKAEIILPFDLNTVRTLRAHNIDTTSPIEYEYDFRWEKQLPAMAHQRKTSAFSTKSWRHLIANDIGTGKTLSVLWAADYLQQQHVVNRVLIVCTLSTTKLVWANTLFRSFPGKSFEVLTGSKERRLRKLAEPADFYIVNHDGLKVLCDWTTKQDRRYIQGSILDKRQDIDLVIIDESAVFRNARTDLWRSLDYILNGSVKRGAILMSGDPMPNEPTDIWAQMRLIDPNILGRSFVRFRQTVMHKVTQFKWKPNDGWEQEIYGRIKDYCIRYRRDECVDLPPLVTSPRGCSMSKIQKAAYDDMLKKFVIEIQNNQITASNEGVKRNKLLQIACGCVYDREGSAHEFDCSEKFKLLEEAVEESHKKIIVYTPFIHSIEMLRKHLDRKFSVEVVNGQVPKAKRDEIFHNFQHGDLQVILAHPKAMAHGLDLTKSHTICWWSPVDDGEIFTQANGRITRPGQTCKQTIVQLICSDIEKRVYQRLNEKKSMQGLLMNLLTEKV